MGHKGKARGRFSVSHQTCFSSGIETDHRETHRHKSRTKKLRKIPRDAATTRGVSLFTRRERGLVYSLSSLSIKFALSLVLEATRTVLLTVNRKFPFRPLRTCYNP